jgi:hypothetical protein
MVRALSLVPLLLVVAALGCATPGDYLPVSLRARISEFESVPSAQPPRAIYQTSFRGQPAYFVTSACCDIPSELYDERGTFICYPGGSIMGGDERCPGYGLSNAATLVWRDTRPPRERERK